MYIYNASPGRKTGWMWKVRLAAPESEQCRSTTDSEARKKDAESFF